MRQDWREREDERGFYGLRREPRHGGAPHERDGFWGRGERDDGYYRPAPRLYSREDYGATCRGQGPHGDDRGLLERVGDEVSSWFEDRSADAGGRQDYRGRGPKGYRRSDERIQEDVSDRLADDPYLDASDIEVAVNAGEVVLTGLVDTRAARRRAEGLAERVSGVSYVQNNLRVRRLGEPAVESPAPSRQPMP